MNVDTYVCVIYVYIYIVIYLSNYLRTQNMADSPRLVSLFADQSKYHVNIREQYDNKTWKNLKLEKTWNLKSQPY